MAKGDISNHLLKLRAAGKLSKPSLVVDARMDSHSRNSPDSYEVEEAHRTMADIKAMEDALGEWDHEEAGKKAEKSLRVALAGKRARLEECRAKLGLTEDEPLPQKPKKKKYDVPETAGY